MKKKETLAIIILSICACLLAGALVFLFIWYGNPSVFEKKTPAAVETTPEPTEATTETVSETEEMTTEEKTEETTEEVTEETTQETTEKEEETTTEAETTAGESGAEDVEAEIETYIQSVIDDNENHKIMIVQTYNDYTEFHITVSTDVITDEDAATCMPFIELGKKYQEAANLAPAPVAVYYYYVNDGTIVFSKVTDD